MNGLESVFDSLSINARNCNLPVPILPEFEPYTKKYNVMEPIIQELNKATSLSDAEIAHHNAVIHKVVDEIILEMKKVDPLFMYLFNKKLFGGSYYDGLKLLSPDEYDLDLALFHKRLGARVERSDIDGFVRIKVDLDSIKLDPNYKDLRAIEKWVDSQNYLITSKFREWFEAILNKTKNNLQNRTTSSKFDLSKSGPAMTLKIHIGAKKVCIDLVPAFIFFKKSDWPPTPFRKNPLTQKDEFLVVPKDPANSTIYNNSWRLSFQEQERGMIIGKNAYKAAIRLLKLLRTRQFQETKMASYYIKTVMMWFKDSVDDSFWQKSGSYIFMMALKYFGKLLKRREIPYYWNPGYNLLKSVNTVTVDNWSNRIDKIILSLEQKITGEASVLRKTMFLYLGVEDTKSQDKAEKGAAAILLPPNESNCNIS